MLEDRDGFQTAVESEIQFRSESRFNAQLDIDGVEVHLPNAIGFAIEHGLFGEIGAWEEPDGEQAAARRGVCLGVSAVG